MSGPFRIDANMLRELKIFRALSDSSRTELSRNARVETVSPGIILTRESELPAFLLVPIDGMIELFSTYEGRETTLTLIPPGASYSLGAILLGKPYLESSRTLTASAVASFPVGVVRQLMQIDPMVTQALSEELVRTARGYLRELKNQKLRTSLERLAAWILKTDIINGGKGRFRIGFGKKTLASHLGMTPENLSRTLAALKENAIQMQGREIRIIRRPALEQIARLTHMID